MSFNLRKVLVILPLVCAAVSSIAINKKCEDIFCTKMMTPTCGFNGETYELFANECLLEIKTCKEGIEWLKAPSIYCHVEVEDLQIEEDASASVSDESEEDILLPALNCAMPICTLEYRPACGFNGSTYSIFSNACGLSAANCDAITKWRRTNMSYCAVQRN